MKMELKPATIKCKYCEEKSYLPRWKFGINDKDNLVRICPECKKEWEI